MQPRVLPNLPVPLRVGIANMLLVRICYNGFGFNTCDIYHLSNGKGSNRSHELFRTRLRLAWCFESTSNEPTFQQPKEAATIPLVRTKTSMHQSLVYILAFLYTWTLPLTYLVLGVKQGIAKILHHRGSNPGTNPCQSGEMVCLDLYLL